MVIAVNETHDLYIRMAFVAMKRTIPQHIRRDLRERGLHQDLEQEIAIIAFEGMQLYSLEGNDYLNFAGRRDYTDSCDKMVTGAHGDIIPTSEMT